MANGTADYRRRTAEAYDASPGEFAGGFDLYFEAHARVEADHFLARLHRGDTILDLGCGVGSASRHFVKQGFSAVGADLSEGMISEYKRRGLASLVRADLEAPPFLCPTFDGVWAHTSLLHMPKQRVRKALERVDRILKPGGALFVALREGEREGFEGPPGAVRWFSYYQAEEFERCIPSG